MLMFIEAIKAVDGDAIAAPAPEKASKDSVDYTDESRDADQRCALCDMYDERTCSAVEGDIDPQGVCDLFEPEGDWAELPCSRSEMAMTGDPLIDLLLRSPFTQRNIDHPVVDRTRPTPYGAGGSVPLENPLTFIDPSVPDKITVASGTYDPADPWVVHENIEQRAMELLVAGGIGPELAYRFSHFCVANVAENAWKTYNGIDPEEAEEAETPILDAIQHRILDAHQENPQLYLEPYPSLDEEAARHEPLQDNPPTDEEIQYCRAILCAMLGLSDEEEGITVHEHILEKAVLRYLDEHAAEIAAIVRKEQPSVADAHATTALGNSRRRKPGPQWKDPRKARSFDDMISTAYFQHGIDPSNPNPDGSDYHLMNVIDKRAREHRWTARVDVRKMDNEQQQVFGWASISTIDGSHIVDKQGDVIPIEEMEKGAYEFVQFSRDMGDMHMRLGTGRMIESMVFTKQKAQCGVKAVDETGKPLEGWWVGFHIVDPIMWAAFKAGDRPELSIGGRAEWEDA